MLAQPNPTGDPTLQAKQRRCRELQALVEGEVKHLMEDLWEATLPFDIQTPQDMACIPHSNIYEFLHDKYDSQVRQPAKYRFSRSLYPPTNDGLQLLLDNLKLQGKIHDGVNLVNGPGTTFKKLGGQSTVCDTGLWL
jgi:hypothetical protein